MPFLEGILQLLFWKHMVSINTKSIPNILYFEQIKMMLNQAKPVKIPVAGTSMMPFLRGGDIVALCSPGNGDVERGKIVLAYYNNGYVLHLLVRTEGELVYLAGNNNLVQLECVKKDDVIAVVQEAYRNNRPLHINAKAQVLKTWLWYRIRPLRYLYGKLFNGIFK